MSDADEVVRLRGENAYLRSLLQDLVDSVGPLIPLLERYAYLRSLLPGLVDVLAPFLPLMERLDTEER